MTDNYKDLAGYKIKHVALIDNPIGFDLSRNGPLKVKVAYFSVQNDNKTISIYCIDTNKSGWDEEFLSKYEGKSILSGKVIMEQPHVGLLSSLEDLVLE